MQESDDERKPDDVIGSDTPNATTIQANEAPSHKKEKFQRFSSYNKGTYNGPKRENTELLRKQDDLHRYDAISSSLDLTSYQQKRGRKILEDVDVEAYSLDLVIFGICVLIANNDVDVGNRYYPNESGEDDPLFEEMGDTLGLSEPRQASMVESLRRKVTV